MGLLFSTDVILLELKEAFSPRERQLLFTFVLYTYFDDKFGGNCSCVKKKVSFFCEYTLTLASGITFDHGVVDNETAINWETLW